MKKTKTSKVIITLLLIGILAFTSCSQSTPFSTAEKYAKAYNELDYNGLIECLDPRITKTIESIAGGAAALLGGSTASSDTNSLIGDLMSDYASQYWDEKDVTATMTVKEISTEMTGDNKAKMTAEFTVVTSTGSEETWQETWSMIKDDGKWYISIGLDDITNLLGS